MVTAIRSVDSNREDNGGKNFLSNNSTRLHRLQQRGIPKDHVFPREITTTVLFPHTPFFTE